ncbi:NUDIX domain-containing protein [Ktedonobacter racemifer]|uniref:NUDIX hydrolase n=1 Tax=Ktedonobacter racemifer DSM 44963 TaxID=485913 RepID=D6TH91_KTERA|nr:NUDIX pyrophosphatase [Ktedonobacter racemifer]EFH90833.1 NUDIX hydrolase [Ktedonobacter racemifer DSM 44963]
MNVQSSKKAVPRSVLRPTHVVTCFLQKGEEEHTRLLLVRRSQQVGSYHGRWAGISGFVEVGVPPEQQAYTEIREETGLAREQVHMLRRGGIVEHVDQDLGRHFYVHPFLFAVNEDESITTDWEATDMRWVDPDTMRNFETVPKLREAYEAALRGEEVQAE